MTLYPPPRCPLIPVVHGHAFPGGATPLPAVPDRDYAVPTMFERVPAELRPPVALALAKAVESIPHENALPGGSVYEMKWDGFLHWTPSSLPGAVTSRTGLSLGHVTVR